MRTAIKENQRSIDFDIDWILKNTIYQEHNLPNLYGETDKFTIVDAKGSYVTNLYTIESKLPQDWKEEFDRTHKEEFSNSFLKSPQGELFKINAISYTYDVMSATEEVVSEGEAIAKAILKDVTSGNTKFYDKYGFVRDTGRVE
ncbi:MAG: hypothetical protein AAGE84_10120 [Cyanobacteria bacterium P01_G01_bin.39]